MSGTSLDGVSAAVVRFRGGENGSAIGCELLHSEVLSFEPSVRAQLLDVVEDGTNDSICRMNFTVGRELASAAAQVIKASGVPRNAVAAIASHGQTIWHVPGRFTLQIGEAAVIAEVTGRPVISDFRVRDVAAGGQGAPLVPIADALLFSHPTEWRALQNIGGIGNVTLVPPGGALDGLVAFDTGPGVVVVDAVVSLLTEGRERMDADAGLSRNGNAIQAVVDDLLALPFFKLKPPRSTGRELFNREFLAAFVERCRNARSGVTDADIIATAVLFTAASIRLSYDAFAHVPLREVLLSGGGAKHPGIRTDLKRLLPGLVIRDFGDVYFDAEAKEAVAFALLGYLHLIGRAGNVPSATGATGPRILGKWTPA
jgi:anhydro-N-acetylmuramic acid kinase